jgi:alpha-L-rhamnosidase
MSMISAISHGAIWQQMATVEDELITTSDMKSLRHCQVDTIAHVTKNSIQVNSGAKPAVILVDDRPDPVNCDPGHTPILRWRYGPENVTAYRVIISSSPEHAARVDPDVWDSGWQKGDGFDGVQLTGFPHEPSQRVWIRLNVQDDQGKEGGWSAPVCAGTSPGKRWIASPIWADPAIGWVFVRGQAQIPSSTLSHIRWATLHVAASSTRSSRQYVAKIWCNGTLLGCGPTFSLGREARADGFDITDLVRCRGALVIAALAYSGQNSKDDKDSRRFCVQVDMGLDGGTVQHWGTGRNWSDQWRVLPADEICGSPLSEGTQYFTVPAEHIRTNRYPFGFTDPEYACDPSAGWVAPVSRPQFEEYAALSTRQTVFRTVPVHIIGTPSAHRIVFDAGGAWLGGIQFAWNFNSSLHLAVRYGEVLDTSAQDVKYQLSAGNTYEDQWDVCPGEHSLTGWGLHVFRYVSLTCEDPTKDLRELICRGKLLVSVSALIYPMDSHAFFQSSDENLNRIWNISVHTIRALTGPIYADSWTRERCPYEADAWIQQRAHLEIADEPEQGQYAARYLLKHRTWPTEWPLYLVMMIVEGWMDTGNDQLLIDAGDSGELTGLLPEKFIDSATGLVIKDPGHSSQMDGDLVDWPASERDGFVFTPVNAVVNALAFRVYRDAARAETYLGHDGDARRDEKRAQAIWDSFNRLLYVPERGAYADGAQVQPNGHVVRVNHCSLHASAFALGCGLVPADRIQPVLTFLRSRGMACSVYAAQTYLDGLFRAGAGQDAIRLLVSTGRRSWMNMIRTGAGALMEAWDRSLKPNTTYSHPWACSPLQLCGQGIMGIRPLKPGYRRFVVSPQLGELSYASGLIPVRSGDIRISVQRKSESILHIDLTVPARTCASVRVAGVPSMEDFGPGEHELDVRCVSGERRS